MKYKLQLLVVGEYTRINLFYHSLNLQKRIHRPIYNSKFARYGITINSPTEIQYKLLRDFIEAIKQNNLTESIMSSFVKFVDECSTDSVILGCTELPILYSECLKSGFKFRKKIFDPLQSTIDLLVSNF